MSLAEQNILATMARWQEQQRIRRGIFNASLLFSAAIVAMSMIFVPVSCG